MPSDMETLIREVLAAQADRAPHRATVLAGLRWTRQRRSYRRLAMVAVGVTVVLAMIGVPVGLHVTSGHTTAASQAVLLAQQPDIPIPYHVTWLPAGYVASMRGGDPKSLTQRWEPTGADRLLLGGNTSTPYVALDIERGAGPINGNVDINGASGQLMDGGVSTGGGTATTELQWEPRPGVLLVVSALNVPNMTSVVIHIARSVVAGGTDVMPQPMAMGWLPAGSSVDTVLVHGTSPNAWGVTCIVLTSAHRTIIASWSTTKSGAFRPPTPDLLKTSAAATVDGGYLAVSSGGLDPGLLKRIADGVAVFPRVDVAWLGR